MRAWHFTCDATKTQGRKWKIETSINKSFFERETIVVEGLLWVDCPSNLISFWKTATLGCKGGGEAAFREFTPVVV